MRFEFLGRNGDLFVFGATVGATKALRVQQAEAEVTEWRMNESSDDDVHVGSFVPCALGPRDGSMLYVGMRLISDVVAFEDRFGATGIDIDALLGEATEERVAA